MIARNNFHLEINTIHIENMINQLDQGKTACGKIAADNVIIQPQPKTDTERGINPAHLVVELKKLLNILPTKSLPNPDHPAADTQAYPQPFAWFGMVESSVTRGYTAEPGTQNEETRNFFKHTLIQHGTYRKDV